MNDLIDSDAEASFDAPASEVQTSAQDVAAVQQEPAVGGSYIRDPETGTLAKQVPAAEQTEQE